jgi:hypothetical protein
MRDVGGCRCCEDALLSLLAAVLGAPAWNGELGGSDAIVLVVVNFVFAVCARYLRESGGRVRVRCQLLGQRSHVAHLFCVIRCDSIPSLTCDLPRSLPSPPSSSSSSARHHRPPSHFLVPAEQSVFSLAMSSSDLPRPPPSYEPAPAGTSTEPLLGEDRARHSDDDIPDDFKYHPHLQGTTH